MHKKVLYCATIDNHFKGFHIPYLRWFKEQGWEVHVAAAGNLELPFVDKKFHIQIQRSPFKFENINAFKELKDIINENQYEIIHCHTPMGGVLARLASRQARKFGAKVIYTAHGFHFCKGASPINWFVYYPIEKILSRFTDCLITINTEDYQLAKKHQFKAKRIKHVHGVGVDTDRFTPVNELNKSVLRAEYHYPDDAFLMFYAAEFNKNKNQQLLIKTLAAMKDQIPKARLLLAGEGPLLEQCRKLSKQLHVEDMIDFLGYRTDIETLLKLSDIAVASSFREGLPVNILEAMSCALPVVASINRGHSELIQDGLTGFLISPNNKEDFGLKVYQLYQSKDTRKIMGIESRNRVKEYSLTKVTSELSEIYSKYMVEDINETKSKYYRSYI